MRRMFQYNAYGALDFILFLHCFAFTVITTLECVAFQINSLDTITNLSSAQRIGVVTKDLWLNVKNP
jgi:hypothetical protein